MKMLFAPLFVLSLMVNVAFGEDVKREITKVTGDVYRFQNKFHVNVFVITGDGVVVTDPINADAAAWLSAELLKMTDQPISHLVYSHSHGDHASGGSAYGPVPTIITHANAPESIDGVVPTDRFDDEFSFTQGSKTFELTYLGPGHGTDLIAMVIRPENVGFIVDAVSAKRLFYRDFPGANVDDWIKQVQKVRTLDFEIFVGGHGPVGVKSDVGDGLAYLEELRTAVLAGLKAGKSADDLSQEIMMEKYKDWGSYDQWRALNVQGMARHLQESGAVN
ncbi:MAG: MBL fold metallo-hydrolase [Arenicellales bacterium]|nr:MBL fold metallo-hydrolase [Arenicellales bacterium]